jgi:hypothetical protein
MLPTRNDPLWHTGKVLLSTCSSVPGLGMQVLLLLKQPLTHRQLALDMAGVASVLLQQWKSPFLQEGQ